MIYVGRISEEKGVFSLISAVNVVLSRYKNICLYIIGDGPEVEKCTNLVKNKQLESNIIFLGQKINPYKYLKDMDLLILPSKNESFGLVLIEAMTLNIPVVATNTVGARSIIQNNKYGYITENNIEGLINGIESFILIKSILKKKVKMH